MELKIGGLVVAYLLGAIPFGYLIVKLRSGGDVRVAGSGSTGATNVTRQSGITAGLLTYVLDVGKGVVAVLLMRLVSDDPLWLGLAATAAIVGHMFPVFLKFKGGKGVATGVGTYLVIAPLAVVSTLVVWVLLFLRTRTVSLASIVATALVPAWILLWYGLVLPTPGVRTMIGSVAVGCALIIARHSANIRRLITGTEPRFDRSKRAGGGEIAAAPETEAR